MNMTIYKLEKWYFDFLTPRQDFFFFYFARIRFYSFLDERIYLTLKTSEVKSSYSKSLKIKSIPSNTGQERKMITSEYGTIELNKAKSEIRLDLNDALIVLDYKFSDYHSSKGRLTIDKNSRHRITWTPLTIDAQVSGYIRTPAGILKVQQNNGYIDYMNSTIFPTQNPVCQLFWGRFQYRGGELAFTCAFGRQSRQRWCKLFIKVFDDYIELDQVELLTGSWIFSDKLDLNYPSFYKIIGRSLDLHIEILIENSIPLSESFFVDRETTANLLLYKLYRYLSLNPRGIKFLSCIHINLNQHGEKYETELIKGITEYVAFGRV